MSEEYQEKYLKVILRNHETVSQDKFDIGRTDTHMHKIALRAAESIYVKQFKILNTHWKEVERHILEWL